MIYLDPTSVLVGFMVGSIVSAIIILTILPFVEDDSNK